jgi:hypothetical protein
VGLEDAMSSEICQTQKDCTFSLEKADLMKEEHLTVVARGWEK